MKILSYYRKWTPNEISDWESKRARGMTKFVLVEGVLKWGVVSLILFLIFSHQSITLKTPHPQIHMLQTAIIWLGLALFYGATLWHFTNKSFFKNQKDKLPK